MNDFKHNTEENYIEIIQRLVKCIVILTVIIIGLIILDIIDLSSPEKPKEIETVVAKKNESLNTPDTTYTVAPDTLLIGKEDNAIQIRYGRELIINTSLYFGPQGKIAHISNGMNCQNCHLEAGTKPFGNNYLAVASTYPKFRARSGTTETIFKRINDCIERSLNGKALDTSGIEMQAMQAYIRWLGKDIEKGIKPKGSGIVDLKYPDRAADVEKGKVVYSIKCKSCHADDGAGKFNTGNLSYQYPPLWGEYSYNSGAGLYRLSRFAGYVKYNMPQGASFKNLQLSDDEAWDVAAFINTQKRPAKDLKADWPDIKSKPVDHPFGPYADNFTEKEHKYGPFGPITAAKKKIENL